MNFSFSHIFNFLVFGNSHYKENGKFSRRPIFTDFRGRSRSAKIKFREIFSKFVLSKRNNPIHKRSNILFCNSYFLYINQTKTQCNKAYVILWVITIN